MISNKYFRYALIILLSILFENYRSHTLSLSIGKGVKIIEDSPYKSSRQLIGLLSYQYIDRMFYLGSDIGQLTSKDTTYIGVGGGLYYHGLSAGIDIGRISRKNYALGTYLQFLITIKYFVPKTPFFVMLNHISNGDKMFETGTPNLGEDFLSGGVKLKF